MKLIAESAWQPIETAPVSDPMDQVWFLAYCPQDAWGALGRVHIACNYGRAGTGMVRVAGSNNDRYATHWMPPPTPPEATP